MENDEGIGAFPGIYIAGANDDAFLADCALFCREDDLLSFVVYCAEIPA